MTLAVSSHEKKGMTYAVVPFTMFALLLVSCAKPPPPPLAEIFVSAEEQGLSEPTLQGILKGQETLERDPQNIQTMFALSQVYQQAVRENADTDYYARIDALMRHAQSVDSKNPDIPYYRGTTALGRHRFKEALADGEKATGLQPQTARYWGLVADAQIELGHYEEAEAALQTMADIRPDSSALTRIAYLREIYGDHAGAVEAMEQAINAGVAVPENLAWALTEFGRLHLAADPAEAEKSYAAALRTYPDYPPALAGLAWVAMANGDAAKAAQFATKAFDALPLPEYATLLGDIETARGNAEKAKTYYALVELGYDGIAKSGTNVDLERAKFLAEHDRDPQLALTIARRVYGERKTIYAADTLAWALLANDNAPDATTFSKEALRTGSHDPLLRYHAAMIAKAAGDEGTARTLLASLLEESPHFSFLLALEAKEALESL